ncbi:hypothetical protein NCCP2495_05710 [Dietzia sp. NCCP-2495]|uniref:WhiB family transcriptional regulator n=1 Tax=Dietzia sp. NCCP-2495 TaxID=2934675 RepID=UPI002810175B|nr:hypothetical protein NCCP2495_05710 [Dietzia sp. NCCP-2495]
MSRSGARHPVSRVVFPRLRAETFAEAPCHTEDENLWEPVRDGEPDKAARVRWREAAELCGYCPALDACARLADAQESLSGVWAGRVPRIKGERIQGELIKGDLIGCGTRAGYQQHRRAGEDACGACSAANRAYSKEYNARRKAGVV